MKKRRRRWAPPYVGGDVAPTMPSQDVQGKQGASGVYAIRDRRSRRVLYVGESHTGALRRTLLRHFQAWRLPNRWYDPTRCEVTWLRTRPSEAVKKQGAWIRELRPRDNSQDNPAKSEAAKERDRTEFTFGWNA